MAFPFVALAVATAGVTSQVLQNQQIRSGFNRFVDDRRLTTDLQLQNLASRERVAMARLNAARATTGAAVGSGTARDLAVAQIIQSGRAMFSLEQQEHMDLEAAAGGATSAMGSPLMTGVNAFFGAGGAEAFTPKSLPATDPQQASQTSGSGLTLITAGEQKQKQGRSIRAGLGGF